MDQPSPNYIVSIPFYEDLRSFDGKIYTSYTVKVFNIETGKEWVVSKRYRLVLNITEGRNLLILFLLIIQRFLLSL